MENEKTALKKSILLENFLCERENDWRINEIEYKSGTGEEVRMVRGSR